MSTFFQPRCFSNAIASVAIRAMVSSSYWLDEMMDEPISLLICRDSEREVGRLVELEGRGKDHERERGTTGIFSEANL